MLNPGQRCLFRNGLIGAAAVGVLAAFPDTAIAAGFGGSGVNCSTTPASCTVTAQDPAIQGSAGGSSRPGGTSGSAPVVQCSDAPFTPSPADLITGAGRSEVFPALATSTTVYWTVEQVQSVLVN
jgi:hypothetical protein